MGLPMELDPAAGGMRVRHDGVRLRGVEIDCRPMPDMLPVLSTMGQFAEGETRFSNVAHVRLKESDRVVSMLQLNRMGGDVEEQGDELVVRGIAGDLTGSPLSSFNDHRVHMSLAVAASRARGESSLTYPNAYRISYPGFLDDMRAIGLDLSIEDDRERSAAGARSAAGEAEGGQRAVESIAIDQAAEMPIVDWVGRWARERPGENAVVDMRAGGTRVWTWEELDREADKAAALLLELGVEPGETVAYQLPNWGEFVILTLACMKIGAICCALMPIFREREIGFALRRSKARVLVVADEFRGREHAEEVAAMLAASGGFAAASDGGGRRGGDGRWRGGNGGDDADATPLAVEHVLVVGADGAPALPKTEGARWHDFAAAVAGQEPDAAAIVARKPAPTALSQLFFTSGSTGEPKGVLHRYDALTRAAMMEVEHLGLGRDDTIFIPTPLAHQTGLLYGMWLSFALGSTQVIQDVWDAAPRRRGAARVGRHLRAGGDAVPRRPRAGGRSGRGGGAAGAADLRRHRRRRAAGAGRAGDHRPLRLGLRRLGLDRVLPRRPRRPRRRPGEGLGHRRPRPGRHPDPDRRRRRPGARPRRGGQLPGHQRAASSRSTSTVPT